MFIFQGFDGSDYSDDDDNGADGIEGKTLLYCYFFIDYFTNIIYPPWATCPKVCGKI